MSSHPNFKSNASAILRKHESTLLKICSSAKMLTTPSPKCNKLSNSSPKKTMSTSFINSGFSPNESPFSASSKWTTLNRKWTKILKTFIRWSRNIKICISKLKKNGALSKKYFFSDSVLENDRNKRGPQNPKLITERGEREAQARREEARQLLVFDGKEMIFFFMW